MKISDLQEDEFNFFYATYLRKLNNDEDLISALVDGKEWFQTFIGELKDHQLLFRYGDGKWTIAEVLVHLIDTERIFQYRAFRISRNDKTPMPGFEQDDYILESKSNDRSKAAILEEYLSVRNATISLFKNISNDIMTRRGTASGMSWSVAALGLAISGHQRHHEHILKERYLI
ncbi:DinB family protein [Maribacter hydrothermalis]|uniref:Damage-inducible protein DinB n=1 Tax=Maribacter hydrothermalis TaxID=1836467 RepID=A0A1B7Z8U4_9FLAO|nr:DinB family protein [Maribacter hydrothermalis]APQ18881.1 damage-inducible protein DinB [Maribacter hydrothermalis]OBR39106.1 damage-inducible protein DinB [Maribacter hydrothermalis]